MAVPIILSFLVRMAAKFGIAKARKMAVKKYGKEALKNITKSKPVKKVTELQRVKAQITKNLAKSKVKPKVKKSIYKMVRSKADGMPVFVKRKVIGKSRSNFGKWKNKYED